MPGRALSPSPIAVFLLGLAERGADGSVEVGGRHVLLRKGQVVDVRPADGDGDLPAFLRDSGRVAPEPLDRCAARARDEGLPLEEVLVRQRLLSAEAVRDVRRGLWLDRLVRGMARATAEGRDVSPLQAEARVAEGASTSLVTLVLDALERRAADHDAGQVGARADHRLEWLPSVHLERATRWARFDAKDARGPVAGLLKTEPAAAPRIAALVRAGLARIVSPDAPPAPAPRVGPLPSSAAPSRATPPLGSIATDFRPERRRKVSVELDPALSPIFGDEPVLTTELPELSSAVAALDDPLDALERQIALLEQASAPGRERAAAWRRFGDAWEQRFGSLEEATRAYREAAAADGEDRVALRRASELCAALGQADLAVAYARAAVAQAPQGPERTSALFGYALMCRRLGKVSEALGALRAAAAADPSDPEPLALSVHLWRELGRPRDAADAATEAAARVGEGERALSLRALALSVEPRSAARAEAYATELARRGLTEAAIAVRAEAVRHSTDDDVRRSLLLAAAEQAEVADRPDVAAELLIRAFDAEPHVDLLYEPLDADLAHAQAPLERALLLEEIAAAAPSEARASWLMRAADARFDLPGDGGWETELRARALELEPDDAEGWRAIGEQAAAQGDPRLLADALERAVLRGRFRSPEAHRRALEELARVSERDLGAPARAAWAWSERAKLGGGTEETAARELARLAPALEAHHARRTELEGAGASRALADHLADDPERRRRALGIYRELLESGPDDRASAGDLGEAIERIERLVGEESGATLALRAERASGRAERSRLRLRRAALASMAGRFDEAAAVCRQILDEVPTHREASLRLRRAAGRLGDRELLREALAAETALALPPQQRARVLTALALELEDAGSVDEAISCAEGALTADPGSAEAALLVTRHLGAVEQPRAALGVVRALFGDSPPILEAWARVARGSGEREAMLEALDAWARAAPYDPEPWAVRLSAFPASETTDVLASAIEGALAPERLVPSLAAPLAGAIGRLAELGELAPAAALAVRSADAFGPHGDPLRELAGRLAASTGDRELRRAALERRIAPQIEDGRVELLHELAALHREGGDRAAEARTHLRVLAVRPHEARSLERLVALYAETGETDRLMAALALELEAAPEAERIEPLLKLAATSAQLRGDLDRAEGFLRDAWKPELETDEPLLRAAGALVALGRARRAVELLREAGRKVPPRRAAPIYVRAVQIALKKVGDPRLSLSATVEGLDRAPSSAHLLLAFEQIALELADVDLAQRTYQRLLDRAMGPHGRRALGYRRARWLERVGGARAALDAYLETFARAPQGGVVYASIERLARELGDLEALVRAALLLAQQAAHPAVRRSMAREAARLLEQELGAGERAFDVLVGLWEGGDASVEDQLLRLASEARRVDPARGEAAFGRVLDGLRKRAEDAWMGEARARLLLRQGRLHALGRRDLGAARAAVEEALAAARDDGGDPGLLAEIHLALASWLLEAGEPEAAATQVRLAVEVHPSSEPARALATQLGITAELLTQSAEDTASTVAEAPSSVTKAPSIGTEALPSVTEAPSIGTEALPSVTEAPSIGTEALPSVTKAPSIGTEALPSVTKAPSITAEAPPTAAKAPPTAAKVPPTAPPTAAKAPPTAERAPPAAGEPLGAAPSAETAGGAARTPGSPSTNADEVVLDLGLASGSALRAVSPAIRADAPRSRALRPPGQPVVSLPGGAADALPPSPPGAGVVALGPGAVAGSGAVSPTRVLVPSAMGRWLPSAPPDDPHDASVLEARAAESPERGAELLRAALAIEPHRLSALRALAEHPDPAPARQLARSLLALVDPALAPHEPLAPPHPSRLSALLRDGELGATQQIWALLWEQAAPLFREIPARPREPNTRVTRVAMTPEARAFAAALDALGRDDLPELYLERSAEPRLFVARTVPPRMLGGPGFAPDEASMRFALARLLELSRSESLLIATLPPERAETVAAAVAAAFGPADGGAVAREAAALASELWRTMPARAQVTVRELLLEAGEGWLDIASARRAAEARGARAGLIACGDLGVAVRETCAADPDLASLELGTERGLAEALASDAVAALVRFALGPLLG